MRLSILNCAKMAEQSYLMAKMIGSGNAPSELLSHIDHKGAQAFMLKHNVMVIPGTNELSDWFKNFDVYKIQGKQFSARQSARSRSGALFHAGFYRHANLLYNFAKDNHARFVIGHSLGAATAQILGTALGIPAVGFASPRVKKGKGKLRNENLVLNICRADDLVTRVPPSEAGFRRLGKTVRLVPDRVQKGIDHSMSNYIKALDFKAFDHKLPKNWM